MKLNRFKIYGFFGSITLIYFTLLSKLFFHNSRLIRFPIVIRGKAYIDLGEMLTTGVGCRLEAFPSIFNLKTLRFGDNVQINDYVHITAMSSVIIGNNVLMASKIYISDCSHGYYDGKSNDSIPDTHPIDREYKTAPVRIEDNVWIGESVSILPGVTVGENSIIGANSVVTKNIPANCIAVGNPARVIKKYNFETKIWEKRTDLI